MQPPKGAVIAISSHVARGSVGNRAMVFALERLGFPVWAVPTVLLPHHPGHGPAKRIVPDDSDFAALLEALVASDRAAKVAGIVSGYIASSAQVRAVAGLVARVKAARPDAIYVCDPVIGDGDRLYVAEDIAKAIRDELLPLADIATPNAFECAWLLGGAPGDGADLTAAARRLSAPWILVTSAPALMRGQIGNLLVGPEETVLFEHQAMADAAKGSGDLLASILLARRLEGRTWPQAAEMAITSVFEMVARTARAGGDELMLAAFQDAIVQPTAGVNVRRLGARSAASGISGGVGR